MNARLRKPIRGFWRWTLWLVLFALPPASAHTRSESYLRAEIENATVRLEITLPDIEAARLAPTGFAVASDEQIAAYLTQQIKVTAAGKDCLPDGGARTLTATKGFHNVEFVFRCPAEKSIVLRSNAFFELVPSHVMFARIRIARDGEHRSVEQMIRIDRRVMELSEESGASNLQSASFFEYIELGIEHILTGPDHLAFVLGFVLISRRLRDLVLVITGFTIGHSVTLGLAVTGFLDPHPDFINVLIALTIALIGAENFVVATHRAFAIAAGAASLLLAMLVVKIGGFGLLPTPLLAGSALFAFCYLMMSGQMQDGAKLRLVITLIFGLIHGFAFAKDLIALRLPTGRMAELLFGFNLGVEIGQLFVVAMLILAATMLVRLRLAPPRALVVDTFSSGLVALGTFWLVSRTYV